jgi:hypothetical protein
MSDVYLSGKEIIRYICPKIITKFSDKKQTANSWIKHYLINQK